MVNKCLAQGHKFHDWDLNPHSAADKTRAWVRWCTQCTSFCSYPLHAKQKASLIYKHTSNRYCLHFASRIDSVSVWSVKLLTWNLKLWFSNLTFDLFKVWSLHFEFLRPYSRGKTAIDGISCIADFLYHLTHWTPLVIVINQSSHLVYLNIKQQICENLNSIGRRSC